MSDNAQLNGSSQPAAPPNTPVGALPTADQFQADAALLRLVIGYMLLGTDELRERLRRWDDTTRVTPTVEATPPRPAPASLGRALVGMAFETETRMRRGFSALLERVERIADEANLAYTRLTFSARGTPLDAVRARLDELLFLSLTAMDRWAARGAIEERQGRRMAETATVGVIDELLDYMSRNPEVRELIAQQSMGMADSAVDEVRGRSASADLWIERLAHSLLHRPQGEKLAKPADDGGNGATPPAGEPAPTPAAAVVATAAPDSAPQTAAKTRKATTTAATAAAASTARAANDSGE